MILYPQSNRYGVLLVLLRYNGNRLERSMSDIVYSILIRQADTRNLTDRSKHFKKRINDDYFDVVFIFNASTVIEVDLSFFD